MTRLLNKMYIKKEYTICSGYSESVEKEEKHVHESKCPNVSL